jgi:hypothetical protein
MDCPVCDGEGGELEPVLDDGTGPFYPCTYCHRKGTVNPFKYLWWQWLILTGRVKPWKRKPWFFK